VYINRTQKKTYESWRPKKPPWRISRVGYARIWIPLLIVELIHVFAHTKCKRRLAVIQQARAPLSGVARASVRRESSRICLKHVNTNLTSCGNGTAEGRKICSAGKTPSFGKKIGTVHGPNLTGVKRDGGKRRRRQKTVLCKPVVEAKPHIRKRGKEPKPLLRMESRVKIKTLHPFLQGRTSHSLNFLSDLYGLC